MLRKMRPEKRVRVEEDGVEGRFGVTWRDPKHVVEMRLSKKVAAGGLKLHFGSYGSLNEANVARDYAAYVRNSTGKEDPAAVGGFRNPHDHPSIFEFEDSPEVFESLKLVKDSVSVSRAQARFAEYKILLELQTREACTNFNEAAREDILVAIESFQKRDPRRFPPPLLNCSSNAEPANGEIRRAPPPSRSEVGVLPTPGREVGASTSFIGALTLEVQITVMGSPFQERLLMNVPGLPAEEISMITKAGIDRIQRELVDKWLEGLEPCLIEPETIPVLE